MSKSDIWMPLYIGDYLADTQSLTTEQHGAYLLLLMACWREGELDASDRNMMKITGLSAHKWRQNAQIILRLFDRHGACVSHRYCAHRTPRAKARRSHHAAKRRAAALQATPSWLTSEQLAEIASIYEQSARLSAETGVAHEVDHIVPLQGVSVRGLHVPWNLRAIPAQQNRSKSNHVEH